MLRLWRGKTGDRLWDFCSLKQPMLMENASLFQAQREGFVLFVAFLLGTPGNSVQKML